MADDLNGAQAAAPLFSYTPDDGNQFGRNLMAFGNALMAAGGRPGATTLGAIGEAGQTASADALRNAQLQRQFGLQEAQSHLYNSQATQADYNAKLLGARVNAMNSAGNDEYGQMFGLNSAGGGAQSVNPPNAASPSAPSPQNTSPQPAAISSFNSGGTPNATPGGPTGQTTQNPVGGNFAPSPSGMASTTTPSPSNGIPYASPDEIHRAMVGAGHVTLGLLAYDPSGRSAQAARLNIFPDSSHVRMPDGTTKIIPWSEMDPQLKQQLEHAIQGEIGQREIAVAGPVAQAREGAVLQRQLGGEYNVGLQGAVAAAKAGQWGEGVGGAPAYFNGLTANANAPQTGAPAVAATAQLPPIAANLIQKTIAQYPPGPVSKDQVKTNNEWFKGAQEELAGSSDLKNQTLNMIQSYNKAQLAGGAAIGGPLQEMRRTAMRWADAFSAANGTPMNQLPYGEDKIGNLSEVQKLQTQIAAHSTRMLNTRAAVQEFLRISESTPNAEQVYPEFVKLASNFLTTAQQGIDSGQSKLALQEAGVQDPRALAAFDRQFDTQAPTYYQNLANQYSAADQKAMQLMQTHKGNPGFGAAVKDFQDKYNSLSDPAQKQAFINQKALPVWKKNLGVNDPLILQMLGEHF